MEANKKLRVGVAGLQMGYGHLQAYKNDPRVVPHAICDNDREYLKWVANKEKPVKYYDSFNDMANDPDIDAISVCLPTAYHTEATVAALRAGKHVLCEKPMAMCYADAVKMISASEETGKKLMISHQQRFGGDIQMIKQRQESGFFGDIYFIRIAWRRPRSAMAGITRFARRGSGAFYDRNWFNEKARGGGVLRDLGTHMIDLALYIAGFPELEGAYGSLYRKFYPPDYDGSFTVDSEDLASAHIKFAGGLSVQLEVSFASHVADEIVLTEIYGAKGGASRRNGEVRFFSTKNDDLYAEKITDYDIKTQSSQAHFIDAIIENKPVPITAAEGAQVVRVMDAIYASGDIIC